MSVVLDGYTSCKFCFRMGSTEDHTLDNDEGACPSCQNIYGDTLPKCACGNMTDPELWLDGIEKCIWCNEGDYYVEMRLGDNDPCTINVSRIAGDVVCVKCSINWCDCPMCSTQQQEENND